MITLLTWDNCALACALLAVLMRLVDSPRASGIASSLALLCATIGQWSAHRRRQRRLEAWEARATALAECRSGRWPVVDAPDAP
jgi:hypothetical protein